MNHLALDQTAHDSMKSLALGVTGLQLDHWAGSPPSNSKPWLTVPMGGAEMARFYNISATGADRVTHRRRPPHRHSLACSFEQIVR